MSSASKRPPGQSRSDSERVAELRLRITQLAHRFELIPLVALLERTGLRREQIIFQSNVSEKSSSSVVDAVDFDEQGRATITLNMGLLGANGLLPAYFHQRALQLDATEQLQDFVRYFDHGLLRNLLRSLDPEGSSGVLRDVESMKASYLRLIGLSSVSGMAWLLQKCFPEVVVRVRRAQLDRLDTGFSARPGGMLDGVGVIGGSYASTGSGLLAELIVEEELDDRGRPWLAQIERRFRERVLPLIEPESIPIELRLLVLEYRRYAAVADLPESHPARLGLERIKGREGTPYTLPIFSTQGS